MYVTYAYEYCRLRTSAVQYPLAIPNSGVRQRKISANYFKLHNETLIHNDIHQGSPCGINDYFSFIYSLAKRKHNSTRIRSMLYALTIATLSIIISFIRLTVLYIKILNLSLIQSWVINFNSWCEYSTVIHWHNVAIVISQSLKRTIILLNN